LCGHNNFVAINFVFSNDKNLQISLNVIFSINSFKYSWFAKQNVNESLIRKVHNKIQIDKKKLKNWKNVRHTTKIQINENIESVQEK
jgi:hypothetical protein